MAHQSRTQQYLNAAVGKPLCRSHGPGQRHLQDQVRTALNSGASPRPAAHDGKVAPLDEVAAHGTHHRRIRPQLAPDLLQQMDVSHMHGIIFYYCTRSLHKIHLELMTKK